MITAPKGTVLTSSAGPDQCYTQGSPADHHEESAALVCRTAGEQFPAKASGARPYTIWFYLKVKSTPTGTGSVVVKGTGVGSTESNRANNRLTFKVPPLPTKPPGSGGGSGGGGAGGGGAGGGGLPITGAPAALIAGGGAAILLVGAALLFFTRRRKT